MSMSRSTTDATTREAIEARREAVAAKNGLAHHEEHDACREQEGMSLRDYFAAKGGGNVSGPMSVEAFVDGYYRPERLSGDVGRRERIIEDRVRDIRAQGVAIISRHDCIYRKQARMCAQGYVKLI